MKKEKYIYKLAVGANGFELEEAVNKLLKEGYELHGSPLYVADHGVLIHSMIQRTLV